jgi:hypothetical protein
MPIQLVPEARRKEVSRGESWLARPVVQKSTVCASDEPDLITGDGHARQVRVDAL